MKTKQLFFTILACTLLFLSCDDDESSPDEVAVATCTGKVYLASTITANSNPKCFIDLVTGNVYDVSTAPSHAAEIDLLWAPRASYYSQYYLVGPSEDYILTSVIYNNNVWSYKNLFPGWQSNRNTTIWTTMSYKAGFENIKTRTEFVAYVDSRIPSPSTYSWDFHGTASDMDEVFYFDVTHSGVKYLVLMKITQTQTDQWFNFTLKVLKY